MAGSVPGVRTGHSGGGSLALAEILDSHGEELYIDLKREYSLDLVEFLRGEVATSPRLILAMVRNLPEGTNYVAIQAARLTREREQFSPDDTEPIPVDPVQEFKQWTEDRRLMAQLINSVNQLVRHTVQWQSPPQIPLVGPSSWRGEGKSKPAKTLSVFDVINRVTGTHG